MYDPFAKFTKHILSNGLEIHHQFWERPWIKVEIVVHSGGREDPVVMPGLAHFVEHVVSQNIDGYGNDQAREFFDTCGGGAGFGSTGYRATRYWFSVPADLATFHDVLDIFGSMLLGAQIKREVERERKVILREFNERYPFIKQLEWDMGIQRALFGGHRLETWNRPLGRPEGFLSATEADLQGFYDTHYNPSNISLVIVGGLPIEQVMFELEKSQFGMKKSGVRNSIPPPLNQIPIPMEQAKTVKLSDYVSFKIEQATYKAVWAFPADFSRQALRVFSQVLDKILFYEIREKLGDTYGVDINEESFQDVCRYEIGGRISPDATPYINELVRKCISMVPSRHDLFRRKLRACMQRCQMSDRSGSGLADSSADDLVSDHRIIPLQEVCDELQKVTFEQMAEAAAFLSSERQYTFITCP